jgi:hypothetical protein
MQRQIISDTGAEGTMRKTGEPLISGVFGRETWKFKPRISPCGDLSVGRRLLPQVDGADERSRTPDLRITNALLYQLSYIGITRNFIRLCSPW